MKLGKVKPTATIVAQFAAGVEVDSIQHDGKVFLPVMDLGEFGSVESSPEPGKKSETSSRPAPKEKPEETKKVYTEDELMEIPSKDLVKILKNDFGINPDDYDGKNTNKKLRDLILDAQENGGASDDAGDDTEEEDTKKGKKPAKSKKDDDEDDNEDEGKKDDDDIIDQVATILEDFDSGAKNKKKTISAICALTEDEIDEDKVVSLVDEFEEDGEADLDEMAEKIADVLAGKKEKKDKRPTKTKKEKEELVDADDLEVGDRVSVWWDDDNQEWFDGEVESIKKGKVTIAYDDDTTAVLDSKVHTKIKRLSK